MDRYQQLRPASIVASITSMPRRWKDAMHVPPQVPLEDIFTESTDKGTIAEHVGAAIAQLEVLREAIRTTSYSVPAPFDSAVAAAVENQGSGPWPDSAVAGRKELERQAEQLLEELNRLTTSDWNKSADAGSTTLTVLALGQGASRVAAERLSIVERLVRQLADDYEPKPPSQDLLAE